MTDSTVDFHVPEAHHVVLRRGDITAIIVDNAKVDIPELPNHRGGYNGIASLSHRLRPSNLFVPHYCGLNLEHIHDGTIAGLLEKFEPRAFPMELRIVDQHTVEVYQSPTGNWKLESCSRYKMLEDGTIEYTFECIPRAGDYRNEFIGLFWASYIHHPLEKAIFFQGREKNSNGRADWIKAITPEHGIDATHSPTGYNHDIRFDGDLPIKLVNHPSSFEYTEPWYYGVSHGMAFVQMFRQCDQIWFAQSPTGGGKDNPAWDFQWFIPDYEIGKAYGFVMRAAYLPYQNLEQIERATIKHREALNPG